MNYDELRRYAGPAAALERARGDPLDQRAAPAAADVDVARHDRDARRPAELGRHGGDPPRPARGRLRPKNGGIAFIGSDGGVMRIDVRTRATSPRRAPQRLLLRRRPATQPLEPDDLDDCQSLLNGIPNDDRRRSTTGCARSSSSRCRSTRPTRRGDLRRHAGQRTWSTTPGSPTWFERVGGDGGQSGFDPTRRRSATTTTSTRRRRSTSTATTRRRGWRHLRPAAGSPGGALVLHAVQGRPERRRARCSRAWSTSGAPMTTAATRRTSRRTAATRCLDRSSRAVRRLGADGQQPDLDRVRHRPRRRLRGRGRAGADGRRDAVGRDPDRARCS